MGLSFNGTSSVVSLSNIVPNNGLIIRTAIKTTATDNIAICGAGTFNDAYLLLNVNAGKVRVGRFSGSWAYANSTASVNTGNVVDVEIRWTTAASDNLTIYINGALDSTHTLSFRTDSKFKINNIGKSVDGTSSPGTTYWFNGEIYYLRIFREDNKTLLAAWDMDEGTGTTVNDNMNAYNGTAANTTWVSNVFYERYLAVDNSDEVWTWDGTAFSNITASIASPGAITASECEFYGFKLSAPSPADWASLAPFKLITLSAVAQPSYTLAGIKKDELVVASGYINGYVPTSIDKFIIDGAVSNGGVVRVAISNDNGVTWYTTSDGGVTFTDLNLTLPLKDYSTLTAGELADWEASRDTILASGIPYDSVKDLDVTGLNTFALDTQIRFAYALSGTSASSVAKTSALRWQFDLEGFCIPYDGVFRLAAGRVIVSPSKDYPALIVNII